MHTMVKNTQSGFTLIELLVAVVIAGILLGIGIPSFSNAVKNSQVNSDYSTITQSLFSARSESVKSRQFVTVCPRQSPESRQCAQTGNTWKHGILVFIDANPDFTQTYATVDPEDEILFAREELKSKNSIEARGSLDGSQPDFDSGPPRAFLRYRDDGTGQANWANGSFLLCHDEKPELSRALNVAPTGDIRLGRRSGTDFPRDVFNREACVI